MGVQKRIFHIKFFINWGLRLILDKIGVEKPRLISKGAEAYIYLVNYMGLKAIAKVRVEKGYRNPKIDTYLRTHRTKREAKLLVDVKKYGIPAPIVYGFFPNEATLILEYIRGELLYFRFKKHPINKSEILRIASLLGEYVGIMHQNGMTHGDLTTSNIMRLDDGNLVLIDFGLGEFTKSIEDFGVELRILYNSLKSAHHKIAEFFFDSFKESYIEHFSEGRDAINKFEEIKLRGRYVEERRERRRFYKTKSI